MKNNSFRKNGMMSVYISILFHSIAIVCGVLLECPTKISDNCTCRTKPIFSFECFRNNERISIETGQFDTWNRLYVRCTNGSVDELYESFNFRKNQQNFDAIDGLQIDSCPESVVQLIRNTFISYFTGTVFNVTINQSTMPPENIFNGLNSLFWLNLRGNQMTMLPENIFHDLTKLEFLYLHKNSLKELSGNVFHRLTSLRWLYLNGNQLTMLPENIFNGLTKLYSLDLHSNNLTTMSENMFKDQIEMNHLKLSVNPWLCDRIFLGMVRLLHGNLDDYEEIACVDEEFVRHKMKRPIKPMFEITHVQIPNYFIRTFANSSTTY